MAHDANERAAYRYMDATRFFAALMVVAGHAREEVWTIPSAAQPTWSRTFTHLVSFGHPAVMVFFVLSGFWISHSVDRKLDRDEFWREFLTDRLSRLLIVLAPVIAVGAVLDMIGQSVLHGSAYWGQFGLGLDGGVYPRLRPGVILGNLLFLQSFAVWPVGTNGPMWSLGFEFWYYVWFAALAVLFRRRKLSPALLTFGLGVVWHVLIYGFVVWLIGAFIYFADRRLGARATTAGRAALMLPAAGFAALAAALVFPRLVHMKQEIADLYIGAAFGGLLWAWLRSTRSFPSFLAPFARYGAGASFSLYLIHNPLFAFVLSAIGHNARSEPNLGSFALILALCSLAVGAGWLFSRITEAHTVHLRLLIRRRLHREHGCRSPTVMR